VHEKKQTSAKRGGQAVEAESIDLRFNDQGKSEFLVSDPLIRALLKTINISQTEHAALTQKSPGR
jgi:hypothetical protein